MTYTTYKNLESGTHYSESQVEEMLDESIDDSYGLIKLCGSNFTPSRILRQLDWHAYRGMFLDFTDGEGWDEVSHETVAEFLAALDR
jgi:hypothetical protein